MQQRCQYVAHQQTDGKEEQTTLDQYFDRASTQAYGITGLAQRVQTDHYQHHHNILNNEEADSDTPVQRIHLAFIGKQLDDNYGAGEGHRYRHIKSRHQAHPKGNSDNVTDHGSEEDLPQAGGQRNGPHGADDVQIKLEPHHEQQ